MCSRKFIPKIPFRKTNFRIRFVDSKNSIPKNYFRIHFMNSENFIPKVTIQKFYCKNFLEILFQKFQKACFGKFAEYVLWKSCYTEDKMLF